MGEARFAGRGKFVWYDMMSTDPKRSLEFYSNLFEWTHKVTTIEGMGDYTELRCGTRDIGGIVPLDANFGLPSHWMPYLSVDDVDAAASRIPAISGTVCVPPSDIPKVGRFAVIGDPTGAFVSIFKSSDPGDEEDPWVSMQTGNFCWTELLTTDQEKAFAFYADLVDWKRDDMDMGPMGNYLVLMRGEMGIGGMLTIPAGAPQPSAWLPYVAVEDADAIAARIVELGGQLCLGPQDIPNMGRFAVASDPLGAMFAIFRGQQQ